MAGLAITNVQVHVPDTRPSFFDYSPSSSISSPTSPPPFSRRNFSSIPEDHVVGSVHSLKSSFTTTLASIPPSAAGYGSNTTTADRNNKQQRDPRQSLARRPLRVDTTKHSRSTISTSSAGPVPRAHSLQQNMAMSKSPRIYTAEMPSPDSPPELSSSKSSKSSSSFRSSILSEAIGSDVSHFEDIALSDNKRDSYDLNAHHKDAPQRPHARALHSIMGASKRKIYSADNVRSIHTAQMMRDAPTRVTGVLHEKCTNMSNNPNRTIRPGFRTSTGSVGPRSQFGGSADSRSPSPTNGMLRNGLTRSPASAPHGFLSVQTRNKSWAPGRKTVKQLEDEYHDSDEDVPDDAVIWNVPISPLEPFTMASRDQSPRRVSSQSSLSSNGTSHTNIKYPSAPVTAAMAPSDATGPRMLGLPRSNTTGSFPEMPSGDMFSLRERHKSWTNDLSEDARYIAAALEAYSSTTDRRQSNSSPISLPPVQRSNIMIDPLPISKEKEAVLARTRPSWLPPKDKKEERRHLKEWEKMMAQSADADRRRAAKQLEAMESARTTQVSVERIWEEHVLPNWDQAISESKTRELWWRGVNSKNRGVVWKKAIGNDLHLTSASFNAALARSSSLDNSIVAQIESDASLAFPETGLFSASAPLNSALVDVLKAHTAYRPDIPYSSNMHRIAALLLLNMSSTDAFIALANVLNRPLPQAFLTQDRTGIARYTSLVLSTMKVKIPALHDHLLSEKMVDQSGTSPVLNFESLLAPLVSSLLTSHLDLELLSRIWDIYVFEGDKAIVRAVVGLCARLEAKLYGTREEVKAILGLEGVGAEAWKGIGDADCVVSEIREAGKVGRAESPRPLRRVS